MCGGGYLKRILTCLYWNTCNKINMCHSDTQYKFLFLFLVLCSKFSTFIILIFGFEGWQLCYCYTLIDQCTWYNWLIFCYLSLKRQISEKWKNIFFLKKDSRSLNSQGGGKSILKEFAISTCILFFKIWWLLLSHFLQKNLLFTRFISNGTWLCFPTDTFIRIV